MIKKLTFGLAILLYLLPVSTRATHLVGVDLNYECLNNCTIRVHLNGYRDCSGATNMTNLISFYSTNPSCTTPPVVANAGSISVLELPLICPSMTSQCSDPFSPYFGVEEYSYWIDYDICATPNCTFTLSWTECCRGNNITSIQTPTANSTYIGSTTLNTGLPSCNNTPVFSNPPVPFICAGQSYTYHHGATDPDGDSLSYAFGPCYNSGPSDPVLYNPGYSANAPLGPDWIVNLDAVTGDIDIIPNAASPTPGSAQWGIFCVYVTEWRNGQAINTIVRDMSVPVINCPSLNCGTNRIEGSIYKDDNQNCLLEAVEAVLPNWLVKIEDGNNLYIVQSDANGMYTAYVPAGTYTVAEIVPSNGLWALTCPPSGMYTVTFPAQNDSATGRDFGNEPTVECPLMWVDIGSGPIRPCSTTVITVNYCNNGTDVAVGAEAVVELENYMTYQSTTGPISAINGNVLSFNLGNVGIGVCGSFTVNVGIPCDTALVGATACMTASVTPDSSCLPEDPSWDRSSVMVDGDCVGDSLVCFTVTNTGSPSNGNMQGPTDWRYYENGILVSSGTLQLCGGCDTVLCFTANGNTARLEVDQRPGHPGNSHPNDVVELCGNPNNVTGQVTAMPLDDQDEFVAVHCAPVVNSFDPNSKHVTPSGVDIAATEHYVDAEDVLEYMIDFQNTGTGYAYQVILEDVLDGHLDLLSIVPGASSHPYTFEVLPGRRVRFIFDNIALPPSTLDPNGSIGWVKFRVNQVPGNQKNEVIENDADIYFDINAPIQTNTVWNTIGWPEQTVHVDAGGIEANIRIYPNPANQEVFVRVDDLNSGGTLRIELYSVVGQQVLSADFRPDELQRLDISRLTPGVYVYRVLSDNGEMLKNGKLIVK